MTVFWKNKPFFSLLSIAFFFMPMSNTHSNQALYKKKEKTYLSNHVIQTIFVQSEVECGLQCAREESCLSVNYGSVENEMKICELNNASIEMSSTLDVYQNDSFTHFEIMTRPTCEEGQMFFPDTKKCAFPVSSCKNALASKRSLNDGVYTFRLSSSSTEYSAFCHMTEIPGCGNDGWTLVMKMNGSKQTFGYHSPYWSDKNTFQVSEGLNGLTKEESKLASYWNTPFTKICLGMTVNDDTKWIKLDYEATSLHSVLAKGLSQQNSLSRADWKSLIVGSSLQRYCNESGFNMNTNSIKMRIGLFGNNEDECETPDSWIGFGAESRVCRKTSKITCGNIALCNWPDNKLKTIEAFGYVLVQ